MVKKQAILFQLKVDPETKIITAQYEVELSQWELEELRQKLGEKIPLTIYLI